SSLSAPAPRPHTRFCLPFLPLDFRIPPRPSQYRAKRLIPDRRRDIPRVPPAIPVAWKLLSFTLENRNNAGATHAISQTSGCGDDCGCDLRGGSCFGTTAAAD